MNVRIAKRMTTRRFKTYLFLPFVLLLSISTALSEEPLEQPVSQEISDKEGVPVLLKHLPSWEEKRDSAQYFIERTKFEEFFRNRDITDQVEFIPGTEAVYAKYNEGSLLIVEFATPQAARDTNIDIIRASASTKDQYLYRRIGNYNVFLFDPTDKLAANSLLDQIKYQKVVTWPYGDPFVQFRKEREFIVGTKSLFIYTVLFILSGFGVAALIGIVVGIVYFKVSDRNRIEMNSYSDAGGLTRLNLDGLSVDLPIDD